MFNAVLANFLVALIIIAIVAIVIVYIVKEKRKGVKCIGCPSAQACATNSSAPQHTCNCSTKANDDNHSSSCCGAHSSSDEHKHICNCKK